MSVTLAVLDSAIAEIEAVRDRWLAREPRDPILDGFDVGIGLALSLLRIRRDIEAVVDREERDNVDTRTPA